MMRQGSTPCSSIAAGHDPPLTSRYIAKAHHWTVPESLVVWVRVTSSVTMPGMKRSQQQSVIGSYKHIVSGHEKSNK
jgi:hypothetical protein